MTGCYQEPASAPVCPAAAVPNVPNAQAFRVTQIRITAPASLTSAILQNTINDAIHRGAFLFGLVAAPGATVRFGATRLATRGACGQGLFDGTYRYYRGDAPTADRARYDPVDLRGMVGTNGFAARAASGAVVTLPIYDAAGALLTELPLCEPALTGSPSSDLRCMGLGQLSGGRFSECTSNWAANPSDTLRAVLPVAAARAVRVSALNTTLCNLLAGADCETIPQAMWPRQPDASGCGAAGWALTAAYAAVSMRPG